MLICLVSSIKLTYQIWARLGCYQWSYDHLKLKVLWHTLWYCDTVTSRVIVELRSKKTKMANNIWWMWKGRIVKKSTGRGWGASDLPHIPNTYLWTKNLDILSLSPTNHLKIITYLRESCSDAVLICIRKSIKDAFRGEKERQGVEGGRRAKRRESKTKEREERMRMECLAIL